MIIKDCCVYEGKNIYALFPVVRYIVDLGEWIDTPTKEIRDFNEQLLAYLPGLGKHCCCIGQEGGFVQRLQEGTYLAHVCEHIILELQNMLGYEVSYGKTRETEDRCYAIIFEYKSAAAGRGCGEIAIDLVNALIEGVPFALRDRLEALSSRCAQSDLGSSTQVIWDEAKKRDIPLTRIGSGSLIQLGYGKPAERLCATLSEHSSCLAVDAACDKVMANEILRSHGIPIPLGNLALSREDAVRIAESIGYPVVVKPNFGSHGVGVSVCLRTPEEVRRAYEIARTIEDTILVEKFIEGKHYRFMVVGDQCVAVAHRLPAHVVGDGLHTVEELIAEENKNPMRGNGHEKPLTRIKVDSIVHGFLAKIGRSLTDVPKPQEIVYLRENDNLSTGGVAVDVTDAVCAENKAIAVRAAQIIGLDIAGIDITIPNIEQPMTEQNGAVIEVNASPGIRMHHYPSRGLARNVAGAIVEMLSQGKGDMGIPIVSVTGTNGKTTTVRMIAQILRQQGRCVGMTSTSGVFIDDKCIQKGDCSGFYSARTLLTDRTVDCAVLETARGGMIKRGLAYKNADVGIVTNVTEDHLGLDGIHTIEDLALVKSLVVEAVKPEGYAVLNADDPNCVAIEPRIKAQLIYFSMEEQNPVIQRHLAAGKMAVICRDDYLYLVHGSEEYFIIDVNDIPVTWNGALLHNIYNAMAAVAGVFGMGVEIEEIREGLRTFSENPGRFNLFEVNGVRVVLDYGHNIDGYRRTIEGLKRLPGTKGKLIGVIGVPGDRTDSSTREVGRLSGLSFDRIYIKEDQDKRGRVNGEIAELLRAGVLSANFEPSELFLELDEAKALELAVLNARPGDIVTAFFEDHEGMLAVIDRLSRTMEIENQITA